MSRVQKYLGIASLCLLSACSSFAPTQVKTEAKPIVTQPKVLTAPTNDELIDQFFSALAHPQPVPVENQSEVVSEAKLVLALSDHYKKPVSLIQRIVDAATKFARPSYPARDNILAVIAVESSFNPKASHGGSKGLMQIYMPVHNKNLRGLNVLSIDVNVAFGADILSTYYEELNHNERGSLLAYNAGIGNFIKGRYNVKYFTKYEKELKFIRSIQA